MYIHACFHKICAPHHCLALSSRQLAAFPGQHTNIAVTLWCAAMSWWWQGRAIQKRIRINPWSLFSMTTSTTINIAVTKVTYVFQVHTRSCSPHDVRTSSVTFAAAAAAVVSTDVSMLSFSFSCLFGQHTHRDNVKEGEQWGQPKIDINAMRVSMDVPLEYAHLIVDSQCCVH